MNQIEIKNHWESAASGWTKWEDAIAEWMQLATEVMLDMAGVVSGSRVLDLACGAGSQSLIAAKRVGKDGHITANDISETMLKHVLKNARNFKLENISTITGAADELEVPAESFDAVICRLGLMLFLEPAKAMNAMGKALKHGGKMAVVVFTSPSTNPFMAKPMQILLRHAGKKPPAPGQPGIFSLGEPVVLKNLFNEAGLFNFKQRILFTPIRLPSADSSLTLIQEAFGAYRAVINDCPEEVRYAAWAEVADFLKDFESENGFDAPAEVIIAAGVKF